LENKKQSFCNSQVIITYKEKSSKIVIINKNWLDKRSMSMPGTVAQPVIPAMWEAEIGKTAVQGQPS
jgi:hypothetical protein